MSRTGAGAGSGRNGSVAGLSSPRVELLAPGGSMDAIRGAVNAGADAVYAGGQLFGARVYAQNPQTGDLLEAIDYCHLHGAKLYLTVNTLLKEYELTQMLPEYLAPIYEHGVDAVLVQDFGVFHFLRKTFPALPLHASTQMTITGPDGVRLLQEMGAERVVLSRELSLSEIRTIHEQTDVELETFVHGALCYCYSGKCLMSSMIGGRSGNRGRCAQPCRLPWDLYKHAQDAPRPGDSRKHTSDPHRQGRSNPSSRPRRSGRLNAPSEQHLLSPKDICTLRLIPDLVDAGITSFKIEGRMKSPEYAAGVTAMYRRHIDRYLEKGRDGFYVEEPDQELARKLFSRGDFSEGYYREKNGRDMITLREKKDMAGEELRSAQEAVSGIRDAYVTSIRKILLTAKLSIHAGKPASMLVSDHSGNRFLAEGFLPSPALNRPSDSSSVLKQIRKTGNSGFEYESVEIDLEDGLFLPVRDLNELRRAALDGIREEILSPYRREAPAKAVGLKPDTGDKAGDFKAAPTTADDKTKDLKTVAGVEAASQNMDSRNRQDMISHPAVTASVCTQEQLEAVLSDASVRGVYLDLPLASRKNVDLVRESGRKVYLMLPGIWRIDTARIVREKITKEFGSFPRGVRRYFDGVAAGCYDQLQALKEEGLLNHGDGFEVIADASLYTWNRQARAQLRKLGVTMDTLPYECSWKELHERGCEGSECVVYGYLPLMLSAQCLTRTTTRCSKRSGIRYLRDRKGVLFAVKNDCMLCLNTIHNSVPLDLIALRGQIQDLSLSSIRYLFTIESGEQTRRVLEGKLPQAVTRGHIRKGIE